MWIPRSLSVDGLIIRLYDPCNHVEVPPENKNGLFDQLKIDRRWVRIRRPTILVGGELTMDRLEVRAGTAPGVNEAPLQLKSNCGTLVIDDFGRQRMKAEELLNRWIVPLDRRYDFLNLPNGKAIQVPFDQLLIFSTNMEPHDLADEAFLRRIPYKIRAVDPTEAEFRELFKREGLRQEIPYNDDAITDLIQTHYVAAGRQFRCCHAAICCCKSNTTASSRDWSPACRPSDLHRPCETISRSSARGRGPASCSIDALRWDAAVAAFAFARIICHPFPLVSTRLS